MGIYNNKIDEIHSFDAQYKNVILKNNNLIIPYINLGVSNHPIHENVNGMTFINYSYMVFKGVSYLSVFIEGFKRLDVIDFNKEQDKYYFGGNYLDIDCKIFNDLIISCEIAYLRTLEFSQYSNTLWSDNIDEERRLDVLEVSSFFEHEKLPQELQELIK